MLRIGLDTTRASPELRAIVEYGAGTLTITGPRSGTRFVRFRVVSDEDPWADIEATLPMGRLVAGQVTLESRGPLDMMRQATGIETWLVVTGDLAEQYTPTTDGPGTPAAIAA